MSDPMSPWAPHVLVDDAEVQSIQNLGNVYLEGGRPFIHGVPQEGDAENAAFQQSGRTLYHATFPTSVLGILKNGLKTDRAGMIFTATSPSVARRAVEAAQGLDARKAAVIAIDPVCLRNERVTWEGSITLKKVHGRALDEVEAAFKECDPQGRLVENGEDNGLARSLSDARGRLEYDYREGVGIGILPESRVVHTDFIPARCLRRVKPGGR